MTMQIQLGVIKRKFRKIMEKKSNLIMHIFINFNLNIFYIPNKCYAIWRKMWKNGEKRRV